MPGTLVGMETKLGYVFNGSEEKHWVFKNISIMNAVVINQNLEAKGSLTIEIYSKEGSTS